LRRRFRLALAWLASRTVHFATSTALRKRHGSQKIAGKGEAKKMAAPTPDEMMIAGYLMEKMELTAEVRSLLQSIARGEVVQPEILVMMRHLADQYTTQQIGGPDVSKTG
jgi:hypothetical protein